MKRSVVLQPEFYTGIGGRPEKTCNNCPENSISLTVHLGRKFHKKISFLKHVPVGRIKPQKVSDKKIPAFSLPVNTAAGVTGSGKQHVFKILIRLDKCIYQLNSR